MYALMTAATRAQRTALIASAPHYIANAYFCDLLQNIDINAPKMFNYELFSTFDSIPELREQFNMWLIYGQKEYRAGADTRECLF